MANMDPHLMLVTLMILALLAVAVFLHLRRREPQMSESRFGPEYERVIGEFGSRTKASAELTVRQKRAEQLHIVALSPADAAHFSKAWKTVQARFVDSPKGSLIEADALLRELMQKRGYPMGDFERRAAEILVDHPAVVHRYRAAHEIVLHEQRGAVSAEGMRQAVIHLRALFGELLPAE